MPSLIPTMPGTHTWVQGGPLLALAGRAWLSAVDGSAVFVWDAQTGAQVTDLRDATGATVASVPVVGGWVDGVGVPVAVTIPYFSVGLLGKKFGGLPIQTLLNAAAALAPTDGQVATLLGNPASSTRVAGDGLYSPLTVGGKQAVRKDSLTLNVKDYGLLGNGSVEPITSLYAAINGATGGVEVFFPPTGGSYYNLQTALPNKSYVTYRGAGSGASQIRVTSGNLLAPSTILQGVNFQGLTLSTSGGHLFDFGTTGGLANSAFRDVSQVTYVDASSLMKGRGTCNFIGNQFIGCSGTRNTTATVPAFDLQSSAGGLNSNKWDTFTAYSNNCTSTPFWRVEGTLGSYAHDNVWINIIGEQNRGGLVHVYSPNGVTFLNVVDWDTNLAPNTGSYSDHVVKVDTSATSGGKKPMSVRASDVGSRFGTYAGGILPFYCPSTPDGPVVLDRIGDPNGNGKYPYLLGVTIADPSGATGSIQLVTTSYTPSYLWDGTVIYNGASLTATMPAAASAPYAGRRFTLTNLHSTALTVSGVTGLTTLAQYASRTVITDGSAWYPA